MKITSLDVSFGQLVRERRDLNRMSQTELADRMESEGVPDVTQITVSRIESGKRVVRLVEAKALARIFRFDLNQVLADEALVRTASVLHRDARSEFVRFRESVETVIDYQTRLHGYLHLLREHLETITDPDARKPVQALIKNIENYLDIDLAEDAGEIMSVNGHDDDYADRADLLRDQERDSS